MDTRDRLPLVPWQERSFLALINSNKRAGSIAPGPALAPALAGGSHLLGAARHRSAAARA
jgi:hypothetical protein